MNRTRLTALALVACGLGIGLAGCDPRRADDVPPQPDGFMDRETFIEVHAQLQLLEAAHRQHMLKGDRDKARARYRASILKEAGVTDSAFTATYDWWYSQPEILPPLLDDVQVHLDSLARNSQWN